MLLRYLKSYICNSVAELRYIINRYRTVFSLSNDVPQPNLKGGTDNTDGANRQVGPARLDAAQIGPLHIATICELLHRQMLFFAQLPNPRRDVSNLLLINHSHFKKTIENFVVQIFIYIFASLVSYMIPKSA